MLVNNLDDLINIYKSGEKVKVSYDKDTRLGDVCSIMLSGGYEPEDFKEEYLVEGFKLIGESLYVKANCLITIDSISVDEYLGVLKPFKGGLDFLEVLYQLDRLIDCTRVVKEDSSMKIVVTKLNESYVAGKFERLFEEKIASFLKQQGVELVRIIKFGHDEDEPECELKYDVYVKGTSREKDSLLDNELGLVYVDTHEGEDTYTMSFSWDMEDTESMELFYGRLTTDFGIENDADLYKDTMERLKRGICWGALEEVVTCS